MSSGANRATVWCGLADGGVSHPQILNAEPCKGSRPCRLAHDAALHFVCELLIDEYLAPENLPFDGSTYRKAAVRNPKMVGFIS